MCRKNKETIDNANLRDYSAIFSEEVDHLPLSMHFPDIGNEYADAIKYIKDKDFEDVLEYHGVNPIKLVRRIEQLQLENLNLKNEISYYENYLNFLNKNYIIVSKSSDIYKEISDRIGEQNEIHT